jgi:protein required for attachment to host cells
MPLEKKTIWVLVADSAQARLFDVDRANKSFNLVDEWQDDVAAGKAQDIDADRPGRVFESANPGRHAMAPPSSPKGVAKARFVGLLADRLAAAAKRQGFDELHVYAAPRTLGELRELMDHTVKARLVNEEAKDLSNLDQPQLERMLGDRFWRT